MQHVLDNPIWSALNSGTKDFAIGNNNVKYCVRDIGLFAGMQDYNEENFNWLYNNSVAGDAFILFTPGEVDIPKNWEIKLNRIMLQMVYEKEIPAVESDAAIQPLSEEHVPAMLDLTQRTKPGPFLHRTILFGNYSGIFDSGKLVSMAGQRLKPFNYTEVSAVCTDPEYTGKGYSKKLMLNLMQKIMNYSSIPMLHLFKDNTTALNLYLKLGFDIRRELNVYFIARK